jgi:Kelch motif
VTLPAKLGLLVVLAALLVSCTDDSGVTSSPAPTVDGLAWTTLAPMPTPRSEVAAASDGERIVVAGGFDEAGASTATVEILDLSTGTWRAGPDLPVAVNHAMASAFDGTVAVVGGYGGPGLSGPTDQAFVLRGNAWEELPPMPAPRGAGGAATVDGRLVIAGGVGPDGLAADMFVLDPVTGRWAATEGPPTGREHLGVSGLGDHLYVVGGRTGGIGSNLAAAEAYDIEAGSWRGLPQMPTARGGSAAAATTNGFVVSAGGEEEAGTFAEAEAFDVRAHRWVSLPPMPTARHGLGVVAVGTVVYTIAGGEVPGLSVTGTVESIDLAPLAS